MIGELIETLFGDSRPPLMLPLARKCHLCNRRAAWLRAAREPLCIKHANDVFAYAAGGRLAGL